MNAFKGPFKGLYLLFVVMLIGTTLPAAAIESRYFRKEANAPAVIIFVHGLFGDANSSWTAKNGSYWPKLLAEDSIFNGVDIFLYEYPTSISNDFSIDEIAEDMRIRLDADGVSAHRELIFLSHSMGGLVTRSYLIKNRGVAARTKFLYLLSSPTTGSELANLATLISQNPQIAKMRLMQSSEYLADLQRSWLSANFGFPTYCAYEKKGTFGILLVSQISASSLCTRPLDPIDADHVDIAKPLNQKSAQFEAFANVYRENAAITFASSNEMSVQYARLFGALEIPKLMALIPNPSVRNDFGVPEYRTFGSGPSWDVVRTKLVNFAEQLPFKDARPVLTPMWTDIAGNEDAALGIFLRAFPEIGKSERAFIVNRSSVGSSWQASFLARYGRAGKRAKKSSKRLTDELVLPFC
jgi:pimeloyl-ACP methyl ester carboxylesterase